MRYFQLNHLAQLRRAASWTLSSTLIPWWPKQGTNVLGASDLWSAVHNTLYPYSVPCKQPPPQYCLMVSISHGSAVRFRATAVRLFPMDLGHDKSHTPAGMR